MKNNNNKVSAPDHELIIVNERYINKEVRSFHIRETGVFSIKRFITDNDGNELFKYTLTRKGSVLFDKNKEPILNIIINIKGNKEMNIYSGQGNEKILSTITINKNNPYGERHYTATFINKDTGLEEKLNIIYHQFTNDYNIYYNMNMKNESMICHIIRSGRKYSLEISPLVDYAYILAINFCFLKLSDIEERESFEQTHLENAPSQYQYY